MTTPAHRTLDGKAALVIGGGGDIGSGIADALASQGAHIVLSYLKDGESAARVADQVRLHGVDATAVCSDATVPADVDALFQAAVSRYGRLDIVVHVPGAVLKKPLSQVTDADFERVVAQNLLSTFLTLRAAGTHLADQGRYIAISSTLAAASPGPYGVYAATKAAVEVMVRGAASEWAHRGITANSIAPGPIDNDFFRAPETAESIAGAAHMSPHGRLGTAADIAPVAAFLASPAAAWVSGQTVRVNGAML